MTLQPLLDDTTGIAQFGNGPRLRLLLDTVDTQGVLATDDLGRYAELALRARR